MNHDATPAEYDLVLLGGGHAHIQVLRSLLMRPLPGVRVTVVSRDVHTPYSGMLPGLIGGQYTVDDCHIDLRPLCQLASARLYHSEVRGLDPQTRSVHCDDRPPLRYDGLSINTGCAPDLGAVAGAESVGFPTKPISSLLTRWREFEQRLEQATHPQHLIVVGGGAAGVELALAADRRLRRHGQRERVRLSLLTADARLLPERPPGVHQRLLRRLRAAQIECCCGQRVEHAEPGRLYLAQGGTIDADEVLWALPAAAPAWPAQSGLDCDAGGFIRVDPWLRSVSHPEIFAAGDVAAMDPPLAKSGVYAVRQGPVLADNLRRSTQGRRLRRFRPQRRFLSLLNLGDGTALASRGPWLTQGRWVWRLKDRIDRRFAARFGADLPRPTPRPAETTEPVPAAAMRCGGCGAKIGHGVLERVMARLQPLRRDDIRVGLDSPDDCAVIRAGETDWVQSVDYFRAFIDDPYTLGMVATQHALSDLYAMGAEPHSALAIATVPHGPEPLVEDTLFQLMAGAVEALNTSGAALIGGHSGEGAELAFGLSVNGRLPEAAWRKRPDRVDDQPLLLLSDALGSGALFAANGYGRAQGRWLDAALEPMRRGNASVVRALRDSGTRACTDITGFGLLGHLLEMLGPEQAAELWPQQLPALPGALECLAAGLHSSLAPDNHRSAKALDAADIAHWRHDPRYALLFDPQTAGPLLAVVAPERADAALAALRASGHRAAAIGRLRPATPGAARVRLAAESV